MTTPNKRPVSLRQARAEFVHRYTMEHVPAWAREAAPSGKFYAPQFATDVEWYNNTFFAGEHELANQHHCYTSGQTWPLGLWLDKPFQKASPREHEAAFYVRHPRPWELEHRGDTTAILDCEGREVFEMPWDDITDDANDESVNAALRRLVKAANKTPL